MFFSHDSETHTETHTGILKPHTAGHNKPQQDAARTKQKSLIYQAKPEQFTTVCRRLKQAKTGNLMLGKDEDLLLQAARVGFCVGFADQAKKLKNVNGFEK